MVPVRIPAIRQMETADKVILRLIASAQMLLSLGWLAMTLVLFNYGGAAASPIGFQLWVGFGLCGVVSAACLFSVRLWARLFTLAWSGALVCITAVPVLRKHPPNSTQRMWFAALCSVTAYLLITSAVLLLDAYRARADRAMMRGEFIPRD
jgi:hypothetical protein